MSVSNPYMYMIILDEFSNQNKYRAINFPKKMPAAVILILHSSL